MCRLIVFVALASVLTCPRTTLASEQRLPIIQSEAGRRVFVQDVQGIEHRGTLLRVDDDELVMRVGTDERQIPRDAIRRVERRGDSLKNGAIIGAIVGLSVGLLQALTVFRGSTLDQTVGTAVTTAVYTGIGVGLDALVPGRTLIYESNTAVSGPQRYGVRLGVSVRW